jgi:hypothetical protein
MSGPWFQFSGGAHFELVVGRDIFDESNIIIQSNERNTQLREVYSIEYNSAPVRTLCQAFPLQGARVKFLDGYCQLYNTQPNNYVLRKGSDVQYPHEAIIFLPHLEMSAGHWRTASLTAKQAPLAKEVTGYFYNGHGDNVSLFLHRAGHESGTIPAKHPAAASDEVEKAPVIGKNEFVLVYYVKNLIMPPTGATEGIAVFLAPMSSFSNLRSAVVGVNVWADVAKLAASYIESEGVEVASNASISLNPVVQVVSRGDARIELSYTADSAPAQWLMSEGSQGQYQLADGKNWYVPPDTMKPAAVPHDDPRMMGQSVMKQAVQGPLIADTVTVTSSLGDQADAVFLVHNIQQTHYFRISKSGAGLKLTLCYKNKQGNEVVVPSADIEWTVVNGNGRITQDGVFTPFVLAPTAFTTIQAVEYDENRWYWACITIPLPMVSVDQVLQMLSAP